MIDEFMLKRTAHCLDVHTKADLDSASSLTNCPYFVSGCFEPIYWILMLLEMVVVSWVVFKYQSLQMFL